MRFAGYLQIQNSQESDEATYECVAENELGVDYSYPAMMYVKGKSRPGFFLLFFFFLSSHWTYKILHSSVSVPFRIVHFVCLRPFPDCTLRLSPSFSGFYVSSVSVPFRIVSSVSGPFRIVHFVCLRPFPDCTLRLSPSLSRL